MCRRPRVLSAAALIDRDIDDHRAWFHRLDRLRRDQFSARWRPAQARWATTRLALRHRSSTTLGSPSELAGASDWLPLAALPPAPASTFGGREMLQASASPVSGGVALSELPRAVVCAALASFISAINLGQTAGCPGGKDRACVAPLPQRKVLAVRRLAKHFGGPLQPRLSCW